MRYERPSVSYAEPESPAPLDEHIHPPVVEDVDHLDHPGQRPDLGEPVAGLENQPELAAAVEALGDQLLVAVLEDMKRNTLAREQDELERKETDFGHATAEDYAATVIIAWPRPSSAIADSFFRPSVRDLIPYEPGKPVEEVQRELGLDRCVKLASNEGPFGPFPAALEAIGAVPSS